MYSPRDAGRPAQVKRRPSAVTQQRRRYTTSDLSDLYTERQQWRDLLAVYPMAYPPEWTAEEAALLRALAHAAEAAAQDTGEPSLLVRIRTLTGGAMLRPPTGSEAEWSVVPAAYRRKGGEPADEVAEALGYPSEDALRMACLLDAERRRHGRQLSHTEAREQAQEAPEYRALVESHAVEWDRMQAERDQIITQLAQCEIRIRELERVAEPDAWETDAREPVVPIPAPPPAPVVHIVQVTQAMPRGTPQYLHDDWPHARRDPLLRWLRRIRRLLLLAVLLSALTEGNDVLSWRADAAFWVGMCVLPPELLYWAGRWKRWKSYNL